VRARTGPVLQPEIVHGYKQHNAHDVEPMSAVRKQRIGRTVAGGLTGASLLLVLAGCATPPQSPGMPQARTAPRPAVALFDDDRLRLDVFNVYRRAPAAELAPVHLPPPAVAGMPRLAQAYASMSPDALFDRALGLEEQRNFAQAVALHRLASQRGYAPSSRRLMELFADGAPGVSRDYRAAVYYKQLAVRQGDSFDTTWRR